MARPKPNGEDEMNEKQKDVAKLVNYDDPKHGTVLTHSLTVEEFENFNRDRAVEEARRKSIEELCDQSKPVRMFTYNDPKYGTVLAHFSDEEPMSPESLTALLDATVGETEDEMIELMKTERAKRMEEDKIDADKRNCHLNP